MKVFDKVIMNPPYGRYPYPHIKIATKACAHFDKGVLLCPSSWITRPLRLWDYMDIKRHTSGMYEVLNTFDADMGGSLGIFTLDSNKEYSLYKDLPFKEFHYPVIAKEVFRILYEEKRFPLLWERSLNHNFKINKDRWYVGVPQVRGHLNPKDMKPKWDFYTLCAITNKPLMGKVNENWRYVFEFLTEKDAIRFREYLDTNIVRYLLILLKRGHGDSSLIKYMPYPLTLEDLAKEVSKELNEPYIEILEKMQKELKKIVDFSS